MKPIQEALQCLALGLRDSLTPRAALYGLGIWLAALLVWGMAFYWGWEHIAHWFAPQGWAQWLQGLLQFLAGATLFVVLVLMTIRLLVDWWLIEVINKQVARHYALPAVLPTPLPWWHGQRVLLLLKPWRIAPLLPVLLFVPVIGHALLFAILAYLNVRTLLPDTLMGLLAPPEIEQLAQRERATLAALGMLLGVVALVPFNVFMPWLLGSTVAHFSQRAVQRSHPAAPGSASAVQV